MDQSETARLMKLMSDQLNRSVQLYLDNCARCGACIDACHAYASTGETRYTAVGRAQNVRRLYENYHTITGKAAPWLDESVELDERWLDKLYETAFTCTGCRRCMVFCPFGIDTAQIQTIAKVMLIGADLEPKPLTMRAKDSIARGVNSEATREKFLRQMEQLRQEVIQRLTVDAGRDVIPLDVQGANVLYVSMTEAHSILPAARIMNAAGESWSLSYYEAVNYGAFVGSRSLTEQICQRIIGEAERLGVKEMVICECGTAFRVMRHVMGPFDFHVITLLQLIERYIKEGRINLDKSKVKGRITYHDPCQIARNGGVYEAPRTCLRAVSDDFVELQPNRSLNWCCGGGGGLVIAAEPELRMKTSRVKAEQLRSSGADIVATACEMCYAQLNELVEEYELDMKVEFVSDLVAQALSE